MNLFANQWGRAARLLAPVLFVVMLLASARVRAQGHGLDSTEHADEAYGIHGESHHDDHAEHGGHGVDGKVLALQLFNFAVLLFILIKFAGGALNKALRGRHDKMKVDLDEAQRLRTEAETKLKAQEARLTNLENEIVSLRKSMQESAEGEKQRMIAAAEARVARMEDETRFLMEQQVKQAELNFKAEVATAAARIAEDLVRRQVNDGDQQRLVTSFVAEVATASAHERTA